MINISEIIEKLKIRLDNLSWTSPDGGGITSFNDGFTVENWEHSAGYPFYCITDEGANQDTVDNVNVGFDHLVLVHICGNWTVPDNVEFPTTIAQREEAALRVREATDAVREDLPKNDLLTDLGIYQKSFHLNFEVDKSNINELNLERRIFQLTFKDLVSRND